MYVFCCLADYLFLKEVPLKIGNRSGKKNTKTIVNNTVESNNDAYSTNKVSPSDTVSKTVSDTVSNISSNVNSNTRSNISSNTSSNTSVNANSNINSNNNSNINNNTNNNTNTNSITNRTIDKISTIGKISSTSKINFSKINQYKQYSQNSINELLEEFGTSYNGINQSSLTGESYPVEKNAIPTNSSNEQANNYNLYIPGSRNISGSGKKQKTGLLNALNITEIPNLLFMGTSVVTGTAIAVVIKTGKQTQFGEISQKLAKKGPETNFDKGIKKYVWLMLRLMLIMVFSIFVINAVFKKNIIEALLFAVAVAVGLTPEMLPMLIALNLSKGAMQMSRKKVIVKRLNSIQNFGAINILCTDKTGTLTLDKIILERHCDLNGDENEEVLELAYINSYYQTGLKNILDRAILDHEELTEQISTKYKKIDEIPFDFIRKVMSIIVSKNGTHLLITKGRPEEIMKRCTHFELDGKIKKINDSIINNLKKQITKINSSGFRTVALAYKEIKDLKETYTKDDEKNLVLKGYVAFLDPPKPGVKETIQKLKSLNIELKILTGDNALVAKNICDFVELKVKGIISGEIIDSLNDKELQEAAVNNTLFTRLTPLQKERIIRVLQDCGNVVGFLGDGINDAPALKAADVGISVNNAADIAKETADIILLEKDLTALEEGVIEGRKVFGNIIKYIRMGSSSNFGNMISPTIASIFLPFLQSKPSKLLLISAFSIVGLAYLIVYSIVGKFFGFEKLPLYFIGIIFALVIAYLISVQFVKVLFNKKFSYD